MAIQFQREHGSMGTAVRDRDADAQEAQLRRAARQHARCWRGGRAGRRAVLLKPLKPDSCMHVCHCSHRVYCFTKRSGASTKIGSCCFPSGLLTCAGTVVLHVDENRLSPSSRHIRGMRMDASGCSTPRSMSGSKRVRSSGSTHPDVTTDRSQT